MLCNLRFAVYFKDSTVEREIEVRDCPWRNDDDVDKLVALLFDPSQEPGASFFDIIGMQFNNHDTDVRQVAFLRKIVPPKKKNRKRYTVIQQGSNLVSFPYSDLLVSEGRKPRTIEEQMPGSKRIKTDNRYIRKPGT